MFLPNTTVAEKQQFELVFVANEYTIITLGEKQMKKVLVINSTPRVNGNSEVLAKEFARGAVDAGHEVEIINLREHNLNYCIGCYA